MKHQHTELIFRLTLPSGTHCVFILCMTLCLVPLEAVITRCNKESSGQTDRWLTSHEGTGTSGTSSYLISIPALCSLQILGLQRVWPNAPPCSVVLVKKSTVVQSRLLIDFAKRVRGRCVVGTGVIANDSSSDTLDLIASALNKTGTPYLTPSTCTICARCMHPPTTPSACTHQ